MVLDFSSESKPRFTVEGLSCPSTGLGFGFRVFRDFRVRAYGLGFRV